jgi:nicotinamidase-related amidase
VIHTAHVNTLLTPQDPVLLLVDPQPGLSFAVESQGRTGLKNGLIALAKTAAAFSVPVVLTTSASARYSGPAFPALISALDGLLTIERTSMNAWEAPAVVTAIEATQRKTILIAGLLTEACVAFTALSALEAGYDVRVVVDACGASSPIAQDTAVAMLMQAGMVPRTWLQVLLELQRDWTRHATYNAASTIVKEHGGAYGIGLDYAAAMLR